MNHLISVDTTEEPMRQGESWWVVHPNAGGAEFKVPHDAMTLCIQEYRSFREGRMYSVISCDTNTGWIVIQSLSEIVRMPLYIFSRYFDSEAFVTGSFKPNSTAKKFDYQSTLPGKQKAQLELFEDNV